MGVRFQGVFLNFSLRKGRQFRGLVVLKEFGHGNGGRLRLTVLDVVVGEALLVQHSALPFFRRHPFGGDDRPGGPLLLLLLLLFLLA